MDACVFDQLSASLSLPLSVVAHTLLHSLTHLQPNPNSKGAILNWPRCLLVLIPLEPCTLPDQIWFCCRIFFLIFLLSFPYFLLFFFFFSLSLSLSLSLSFSHLFTHTLSSHSFISVLPLLPLILLYHHQQYQSSIASTIEGTTTSTHISF